MPKKNEREPRIDSIRVKKKLIDLNMKQKELATKVGMKEKYLTDMLSGRKPGTKYIRKIYGYLGLEKIDDVS